MSLRKGDYIVFPPGVKRSENGEVEMDTQNLSPFVFRLESVSWIMSGGMVVHREYHFKHHLELPTNTGSDLPDVSGRIVRGLRVFEDVRKIKTSTVVRQEDSINDPEETAPEQEDTATNTNTETISED